MWEFTNESALPGGYPGMEFRSYSDEEMADAVKALEPIFKETHGPISACGLWVQPAVTGKGGTPAPSPASAESTEG